MALISCPECNNEISNSCVSCPNCGYNIKNSKSKVNIQSFVSQLSDRTKIKPRFLITGFICIIVVLVLMVSFGGRLFLSNGERYALKAVQTIQDVLLVPESIRIYDIYYQDTSGDTANEKREDPFLAQVYVYYGATNKGGGISDSKCVVTICKSGDNGIADPDKLDELETIYYEKNVQEILSNGLKISEVKIQKMIN